MRASLRVMASPSPVPPKCCAVEASAWVNSSNSFACCSEVMPMPVSETDSSIHSRNPFRNRDFMSTRPIICPLRWVRRPGSVLAVLRIEISLWNLRNRHIRPRARCSRTAFEGARVSPQLAYWRCPLHGNASCPGGVEHRPALPRALRQRCRPYRIWQQAGILAAAWEAKRVRPSHRDNYEMSLPRGKGRALPEPTMRTLRCRNAYSRVCDAGTTRVSPAPISSSGMARR
jgi:hypothetical protein